MINFETIKRRLGETSDGMFIKNSQEVSDAFLSRLRDKKHETNGWSASGENLHLAEIPVAVVEQWMREGFNIYDSNVTGRDIQNKLAKDNLGAFLTSNMKV